MEIKRKLFSPTFRNHKKRWLLFASFITLGIFSISCITFKIGDMKPAEASTGSILASYQFNASSNLGLDSATDSHTYSLTGGSATYSSGWATFDGTNSLYAANADQNPIYKNKSKSQLTFLFSMKFTDVDSTTWEFPLSLYCQDYNSGNYFGISYGDTNGRRARFCTTGDSWYGQHLVDTVPTVNTIYNIAVVMNSSQTTVYVNGSLKFTVASFNLSAADYSTAFSYKTFSFGGLGDWTRAGIKCNCAFDYFEMYDGAFTESEIKNYFKVKLNNKTFDLLYSTSARELSFASVVGPKTYSSLHSYTMTSGNSSYFSIPDSNAAILGIAANTPPGTYQIGIQATERTAKRRSHLDTSTTVSATMTVIIRPTDEAQVTEVTPVAHYKFENSGDPGQDSQGKYNLSTIGTVNIANGLAKFNGIGMLYAPVDKNPIKDCLVNDGLCTIAMNISLNNWSDNWETIMSLCYPYGTENRLANAALLQYQANSSGNMSYLANASSTWDSEAELLYGHAKKSYSLVMVIRATGQTQFYIDGAQLSYNKTTIDSLKNYPDTSTFGIGGIPLVNGSTVTAHAYKYLNASISDIKIYNSAFSWDEAIEYSKQGCVPYYSIEVDSNGGTGGKASQTSYFMGGPNGATQTVTLTQPTKTGYTFTGWTLTKGTYYYTGGSTTAPTVEGNTLTIPITNAGKLIVTANWSTTPIGFTPGSISTTYSNDAQNMSPFTAATCATGGGINYSIISGNDGNYFSLTNLTDRIINAKAGTPAGTYPLTVRATNTSSGVTKDGVLTITINIKEAAISFDSSQMTKMIGADPFTNTLTNTGDGSVTYSSSDSSVASVDSSGLVTILSFPGASASIRIHATVNNTANCTYEVKSIYYILTITKLPTSDGHLIIQLNNKWKEANAKSAIHFWGKSGSHTDFYSKPLTDDNYYSRWNVYIIDIPEGSWTGCQVLRVNPSCPIDYDTWDSNPYTGDNNWGKSEDIVFNTNENFYSMNGEDNGYMTFNTPSNHPIVMGGESVYLDLSSFTDWESNSPYFGIYFKNGFNDEYHNGRLTKVEGFDVSGGGANHLYEYKLPIGQAFETVEKITREKPDRSTTWTTIASNYSIVAYKNVCKVTSWDYGVFDWNMDDLSRANCFGTYFLNSTGCDRYGINRPTIDWNEAKAQFNNMSNNAEALFTNCDPLEGGTTYEQAAARYDYIVRKYGTSEYENFAERTISNVSRQSGLSSNGFYAIFGEENSINTLIIIVSSSVSIIAISTLTILCIRKRARK